MVRTEGIKRQSRTQSTRTACSTRVANYRHYLWRRESTAKNSDDEERPREREREREREEREEGTWQRHVCKLLPIWTSETGTRARLVRAGFTTVCFYLVLLLHPLLPLHHFFMPGVDSEISVGLVCIRCLDNEAKPTIYIPLAEFEAKLAVIVEGAR